jgi:SAM-dependent methyltransferase
MKPENLKLIVKEKYGEIADQSNPSSSCCGGSSCCGTTEISNFSDDYKLLEGYNPDADLGLGCGLPTEFAGIKKGDHVLDLGSGAGNDCFVAWTLTGEEGKVTGIDFTESMVQKANENLKKIGFTNMNFILGDIENIPLPDNSYDVVISNCVLNLVPDKEKAFKEIHRVLKPEGHFSISDIVLKGTLPEKLQEAAEMYAGCVSGAVQIEEYLQIIKHQGFRDIKVNKERQIFIPDNTMLEYLTNEELEKMKSDKTGIFSITVNAVK